MSAPIRKIRKLSKRREVPFEERPLATQGVLALWAAVVAGMIVVAGGFDDPRPMQNGWTRLVLLAMAWGSFAWIAALPKWWLPPRMRFGFASSLVFHSLLAILLMFATIQFLLTEKIQSVEPNKVVEEVEIPPQVEVVQASPTERPLFETPVPTEDLQQSVRQPALERPQSNAVASLEPTVDTQPDSDSPTPQALVERRPQTALAHRADAPGERSRRTRTATVAEEQPAPVARPDDAVPLVASVPLPSPNRDVARQATATPEPSEALELPSPAPSLEANRRTTEQVAQVSPAPRTDPHSPAALVEAPTVAQNPPSEQSEPSELPAVAAAAAIDRPQQAAPRPGVADTPPPDVTRPVPTQRTARRDTRDTEAPLAQAPTPLDREQPVDVAQVTADSPETRQLAETSQTQSTQIDERQPVGPQPTRSTDRVAPSAAVAQATPDAARPVPRAEGIRRRETETPALPRDVDQAPRVASSSTAPMVTEAVSEPAASSVARAATPQPSTSPAPRAIAESRGGNAGTGEGLNAADDAPASPTFVAPYAAATAERSRASQTERGPALAPSTVARSPHARADAAIATSTLPATDDPNPQVAGAERPSDTSQSSSAALERQFSDAPLSDVTADAGAAQVDTGPPQIVPQQGTGRGDRGGRLAQQAPQVQSGLGPRRRSAAEAAPAAASIAEAASGAGSPSSRVAQAEQPAPGGAPSDMAPGRMADEPLPQGSMADVPAGRIAGGGQTPPSEGPPPAGSRLGPSGAPSSTGSASDSPALASGGMSPPAAAPPRREGAGGEPRPQVASGGSASGRPSSARGGVAAIVGAADPLTLTLITPLVSDGPAVGPSGSGESAGPAIRSEREGTPGRRTLSDAADDVGGTGDLPSPDPGIPQRIARRQADPLRLTPGRYANRSEGGARTRPGRERRPAPAFAPRSERLDLGPPSNLVDVTPRTEAAIELGLEFLAPLQRPDGHWGLAEFGDLPIAADELPTMKADGAATGMALLAFLGAGYDHFGDKYQHVVDRGLQYLIDQQGERGDIFPERGDASSQLRFYSHGIAALALCEAYGMTGDPELKEPAQKALDYIMETQQERLNGWRYYEQTSSDLSVTGWQMMALRSGQLAGLRVDPKTYERVEKFVDACRDPGGDRALFRYNPYITLRDPRSQQHGRNPGTVMTSVGMLMQLYLGETRESQRMQIGADHLMKNLPTHGDSESSLAPSSTPNNPLRDTYYWYYATQVMFHMGGDYWKQWHEHLHPLLVDNQTQQGPLAGSWHPNRPVRDRWGAHGGRIYVTCLNLLSLEVSYRHLPLYEMTAPKDDE